MGIAKLLKRLFKKEVGFNPYNKEHLEIIKETYNNFKKAKKIYDKMYEYYKGDTDALRGYKTVTERSNLKINTNFIKKFIKEEVSYTLGNDIVYESRLGNEDVINDIEYYKAHWNELHDSDLMKYLLMFTEIYELYYINDNADFCSKIIKPTDGYACKNKSTGKVLFFINTFKNDFDTGKTYLDIYTDDFIYHLNDEFEEVDKPTENLFGEVPVSFGALSEELADDSLHKDIKGLQDAFETNLSDIGNEISDFRNAYLLFKNAQIEENDVTDMKRLGIIQFPQKDGGAEWLIKNINDTFIQNTLDRYQDTMYQLACHINHNEKLQSNVSGVALEARLIALRNKCTLQQKAHANMIKERNRFLFIFLSLRKAKDYDYKDVKVLYTPNIPSDDTAMADIVSKIPEGFVSKDTLRGKFSFVNNKVAEKKKIEEEMKNDFNLEDYVGKHNE